MSTQRPRVTVTLTDEQNALLGRISRLNGVSKSHLLADLFDTVSPALGRVADAVESAQIAQRAIKPELLKSFDSAQSQVSDVISTLNDLLDNLQAGNPPSSNTGVTPSDLHTNVRVTKDKKGGENAL